MNQRRTDKAPRKEVTWFDGGSTTISFFMTIVAVAAAGSEGDLRLIENGQVSTTGRGVLQVYHDGYWGTVCDDSFSNTNAKVVCRQLGFSETGGHYAIGGSSVYGAGIGPVWLDDVVCTGTEEKLVDCTSSPWGEENCGHDEDIAVVCTNQVFQEGDVRLVDGPNPSEGRLQIYHDGIWGTVCDDDFSNAAANVVCRQLGYKGGYGTSRGVYGEGVDPTWIDDVQCTGNEATLSDCPNAGWGEENCSHREDVGIVCLDDTFSEGDIMLADGDSNRQGRLQVYHDGKWGTVCDDDISNYAAKIICQSLGFEGGYGTGYAGYGQGVDPTWLDNVACVGTETNFLSCPNAGWGEENCGHYEDVGIDCQDQTFSEGDIQLVNGTKPSEGRLQIYHDGIWGTVCDDDFSNAAANVVCRQLGYKGGYGASRGAYGQGIDPTWMDSVQCTGNEATLFDCPNAGWGEENCGHYEDVGIICQDEIYTEGTVQLVNGTGPFEGRLQIYHDGIWGTVCDDEFSSAASNVVCRQLGYQGGFVVTDHLHPYGQGVAPVWLDQVQCLGTEATLSDCPSDDWGVENCGNDEDVGVRCYPPMSKDREFVANDVILGGGETYNEGMVLVYAGKSWGGFCVLEQTDVNVLCQELGFIGGLVKSYQKYTNQLADTFILESPGCTGNEDRIADCPNVGVKRTISCSAEGVTCFEKEFPRPPGSNGNGGGDGGGSNGGNGGGSGSRNRMRSIDLLIWLLLGVLPYFGMFL